MDKYGFIDSNTLRRYTFYTLFGVAIDKTEAILPPQAQECTMKRRKPPEDKRRAIENLLSRDGGDATMIRRPGDEETKVRKVRPRSFELGEKDPFELEKPDDAIKHAHINLGDDPIEAEVVDDDLPTSDEGDSDDGDMPPLPSYIQKSGGSNSARNAIIIAAAILFIGAGATALILAREQIMGLFGGGSASQAGGENAAARIAELEKENADLRAAIGEGGVESAAVELGEGDAAVELSNLRRANASLQQNLEEERDRANNLQNQLDTFKSAGPSDNPELTNARGQVEKLTADLAKARTTISELQQQVEDNNERMVSYSRENSRLNRELETAKSDAQSLGTLRRDNERLQARVSTLSRDLDSANSQINVLRSQLNESQGSGSELENVNSEYRRVLNLLNESRDANNHKQDRIDELLAENSKLREQVNSQQNQSNTRRASNSSSNNRGSTSGITRDPKATKIVRPQYPAAALRRKVSGTVELNVLVSDKGLVVDVKVIRSPDPLRTLDRAAIAAVRQWRFDPAMRNGQPIQQWHKVPMEFTLNRDEE